MERVRGGRGTVEGRENERERRKQGKGGKIHKETEEGRETGERK